jgi:hypothetical protein
VANHSGRGRGVVDDRFQGVDVSGIRAGIGLLAQGVVQLRLLGVGGDKRTDVRLHAVREGDRRMVVRNCSWMVNSWAKHALLLAIVVELHVALCCGLSVAVLAAVAAAR